MINYEINNTRLPWLGAKAGMEGRGGRAIIIAECINECAALDGV